MAHNVDAADRERIEKLAVAVARNGFTFEEKVAEKQLENPDFAFIRTPSSLQTHYRHVLAQLLSGSTNPEELERARLLDAQKNTVEVASAESPIYGSDLSSAARCMQERVRSCLARFGLTHHPHALSPSLRMSASREAFAPMPRAPWAEGEFWDVSESRRAELLCGVDLGSHLTRSRAFHNPDALDGMVAYLGLDPWASTRADVRFC